MKNNVLLVAGSRTITNYQRIAHILSNASYVHDVPFKLIIHGGAKGVDEAAGRWALERGYPVSVFHADWELWGKSAGPERNRRMVDACTHGIVVWNGTSRGTAHTINLMRKANKPLVVVYMTDGSD